MNNVRKNMGGGRIHTFAVCAYGDSPYLETCLKSLRGQTVSADIILCTSTPSPYLERLAEKYSIPCYVRRGESSIGDDWNFAYHMADSEFVTIAHQDDIYGKRYLETFFKELRRYPDMTLFTGDYAVLKGKNVMVFQPALMVKRLLRLPLALKGLSHRKLLKRSALLFGNPVCCPACAYRKSAYGEPLFRSDYQFALDWDTLLRLSGLPGRFVCSGRPLMLYRIHGEATTKKCIEDNRRAMEEEDIYRKLWPGPVAKLLIHFYKKAYGAYD